MSEEERRPEAKKDIWDKLDIAFRVLASLAVAVVGSVGSWYLQSKQQTETRMQLYMEMMSNRERVDSDLRKGMLNSIIKVFLESKPTGLQERVLALELLTYNFHDVVDLGSLFEQVQVEFDVSKVSEQEKNALETRLQRVALEVINKQLAALREVSAVQTFQDVYFEDLEKSPRGITVLSKEFCLLTEQGECEQIRKFFVHVLDRDERFKQLKVHLEVSPPGKPREFEVSDTFWVSFFDFPLIDNTRLKNGDRVAVVLRRWEKDSAELACVYFPGLRASLKDMLYYDEVVKQVLGGQRRN